MNNYVPRRAWDHLAGKPLTQVEKNIAVLVSDGMTNREIAHEVGISPNTVKSHMARINGKLGTRERSSMVAQLLRSGVID